jgi:hypothetical protein
MVDSDNATAVKTGSSPRMIAFIKNLFLWAPHALPQLVETSFMVSI